MTDKYDPIAYLNDLRRNGAESPGFEDLGQLMRWVSWAQDRIYALKEERDYLAGRNAKLAEDAASLRGLVDKNPPVRKALPRRDVFELDGWKCAYCRCGLTMETGHADHLVPMSLGGSDELCNLVAACAACNLSKGSRHPEEWNPKFGDEWLAAHMDRRREQQAETQAQVAAQMSAEVN
jgi:hypothetical protein